MWNPLIQPKTMAGAISQRLPGEGRFVFFPQLLRPETASLHFRVQPGLVIEVIGSAA